MPAWATSSFTTVAGQAGWRGVKPSLDALILVAAAGSTIKAGASQCPMRIVRLAALIAPADATGEQSPPGYSFGRGSRGSPSGGNASQHLQPNDGFKKSLSISAEVGSLAGDRVVSHERSRPADLSRRDRLFSRNGGSYPSHYCSCVSRCALLAYGHRCRNAVTVDGASKHRQLIASDKTSSFSAAACGRSGFRKWATRVDHLIGCTIDDFATRTREIASGRGVEPPPHIFNVKPSSPRCRQRPAD